MSWEGPSRTFVGVDMALDPDETAMVIAEVGKKAGAMAITDCMETMNQAMQGIAPQFQAFSNMLSDDAVMAAALSQMAAREPGPELDSEEDDGWGGWPLGGPDGEA